MRVGRENIDVIHCPKGCKPNWNSVVVHITSVQVKGSGWQDLADAWNTIEVWHDPQGVRRVRFDAKPGGLPTVEVVGSYLQWSPAISAAKVAARLAAP